MAAFLANPLIWDALGALLGAAIIWWVQRLRKRDQAKAAKTERLLRAFAASLDWQKNMVHATHDGPGAQVLRDLTRAITGEATGAGLQNNLDEFLRAHGLNQKDKLRHVTGRLHG